MSMGLGRYVPGTSPIYDTSSTMQQYNIGPTERYKANATIPFAPVMTMRGGAPWSPRLEPTYCRGAASQEDSVLQEHGAVCKAMTQL